jgi:hypothetical protein
MQTVHLRILIERKTRSDGDVLSPDKVAEAKRKLSEASRQVASRLRSTRLINLLVEEEGCL